MKILVYSVITNGYDAPKQHNLPEGTDYILTTYNTAAGDHVLFMKEKKIFPVPGDYDVVIWVDGNLELNISNWEDFLTEEILGNRISMFKHPERDCLYEEAEVCKSAGKGDPLAIESQIKRYREEGMPKHYGLWACGLIVYVRLQNYNLNTIIYNHISMRWFDEVKNYSRRDQISLPYVLWKSGERVGTIPGNIFAHPNIKYYSHA